MRSLSLEGTWTSTFRVPPHYRFHLARFFCYKFKDTHETIDYLERQLLLDIV